MTGIGGFNCTPDDKPVGVVDGQEPAEEAAGGAHDQVQDGHTHGREIVTLMVARGNCSSVDCHQEIDHQHNPRGWGEGEHTQRMPQLPQLAQTFNPFNINPLTAEKARTVSTINSSWT